MILKEGKCKIFGIAQAPEKQAPGYINISFDSMQLTISAFTAAV
jgi:hypothetical protein